nr:MAG TPA: hypothetical protein [Bacteriophage sp.]
MGRLERTAEQGSARQCTARKCKAQLVFSHGLRGNSQPQPRRQRHEWKG